MLFWTLANQAPPPLATTLGKRLPDALPNDPSVYREFRQNDAELKAWLPRTCWNALDEIADELAHSRADHVRHLLFLHLYGDLDFYRMKAAKEGFFYLPPPSPEADADAPLFSRRRSFAPELGKAEAELRLWLPQRMKTDLDALASHHGEPLSSHVRRILCQQVFGRHYLADG